MTTQPTRDRMRREQSALLVACLTGRHAPLGVDPVRVAAVRHELETKRVEQLARSWPEVRAALGEDFQVTVRCYASAVPLPRHGGPVADGLAFARRRDVANRLDAHAHERVLRERLRWRVSPAGLRARRGPTMLISLRARAAGISVAGRTWIFRRTLRP